MHAVHGLLSSRSSSTRYVQTRHGMRLLARRKDVIGVYMLLLLQEPVTSFASKLSMWIIIALALQARVINKPAPSSLQNGSSRRSNRIAVINLKRSWKVATPTSTSISPNRRHLEQENELSNLLADARQ